MDGEEDFYTYHSRSNLKSSSSTNSEIGEMSFMIVDYLKEAMKVRII